LPDVNGVIGISRLLLPPRLRSEQDLREAAARLKAERVLLYTFKAGPTSWTAPRRGLDAGKPARSSGE